VGSSTTTSYYKFTDRSYGEKLLTTGEHLVKFWRTSQWHLLRPTVAIILDFFAPLYVTGSSWTEPEMERYLSVEFGIATHHKFTHKSSPLFIFIHMFMHSFCSTVVFVQSYANT